MESKAPQAPVFPQSSDLSYMVLDLRWLPAHCDYQISHSECINRPPDPINIPYSIITPKPGIWSNLNLCSWAVVTHIWLQNKLTHIPFEERAVILR